MIKPLNQNGFTLVELLLATTFFSFILVLFSVGFIQINRTFQKGASIKEVTDTGRNVIEDLARNIRTVKASDVLIEPTGYPLGDGSPPLGAAFRLCLGDVRYAWNEGDVVDINGDIISGFETVLQAANFNDTLGFGEVPLTLVKSTHGACGDPLYTFTDVQLDNSDPLQSIVQRGATSLLSENVIIQSLVIDEVAGGLSIDLTLSTVDPENNRLTPGDATTSTEVICDGFVADGNHFCDVVRFRTVISYRGQ